MKTSNSGCVSWIYTVQYIFYSVNSVLQSRNSKRTLTCGINLLLIILISLWSEFSDFGITCEASWEKTASKVKVFGAEAKDRLWPAAECPLADVSQRVSCFFLPSTLRNDMDSEDSLLWTEQIRTITLTWTERPDLIRDCTVCVNNHTENAPVRPHDKSHVCSERKSQPKIYGWRIKSCFHSSYRYTGY